MPTYHHIFDLKQVDLSWQRLEVILSACIDMVEAEKAVAVNDNTYLEHDSLTERPRPRPWIAQPYTSGDLTSCLDTWKRLVHAIEARANIQRMPDSASLCSRAGTLKLTIWSPEQLSGVAWIVTKHGPKPLL